MRNHNRLVSILFDDMIVTFPLLFGELFPLADLFDLFKPPPPTPPPPFSPSIPLPKKLIDWLAAYRRRAA